MRAWQAHDLSLEPRMCVQLYEKCDAWGVVFTATRRLQQTSVSCKRSSCNKLKNKILEKSTRLRLCEETAQRVSPFSHAALYMSPVADFLFNCHELHQKSFHCHQDVLDEEDDGCHRWYCQKGIGASCSSPDSWWRRCNSVNASLKSERFLIGPIFPNLLREIHQFFLYRKYSSSVIRKVKSFCASLSIWMQTSSVRSMLIWDSRNMESFWKRSWIPSNLLLMHLLVKSWATKWSFCSLVFPYRCQSGRPFLMTQFGIERRSNVHRRISRLDWFSLKRCPQVQ